MSYKLLLADDSITIRKVVGIIFANEDYALSVVDNGNAALEKASEIMPDIIMADVMMPGKTGYDVCTEVRRDPALKHIPLLLLTGAFEPFDEEKARQCGADDFISKPFESQQLIEKVRSLIAMGKERKVSAPLEEAPEIVEPQPAAPQLVAPSLLPEAPAAADMGGVFLSLGEEEAEKPALKLEEPAVMEKALEEAPEEVEEALPEDDLWDVFSLEEGEEEEEEVSPEFQALPEEEVIAPLGAPAEEEDFSFSLGEEETAPLTTGREELPGAPLEAMDFEFEEETFGAEDESPVAEKLIGDAFEFAAEVKEEESFVSGLEGIESAVEPAIPEYELEIEPEEESLTVASAGETMGAGGVFEIEAEPEQQLAAGLQELTPPAPAAAPEAELQFAAEEEYLPVMPVAPPPLPEAVAEPVAPVAEPPAPAGQPAPVAPALSEEQLAAALANVSREVIERIVWEVVPDLAETLIREEIRKLKEGLRN